MSLKNVLRPPRSNRNQRDYPPSIRKGPQRQRGLKLWTVALAVGMESQCGTALWLQHGVKGD